MCDNYYHIYCQHYTPKHAGDALWVFHTDKAINNFLPDLICSVESAQLGCWEGTDETFKQTTRILTENQPTK